MKWICGRNTSEPSHARLPCQVGLWIECRGPRSRTGRKPARLRHICGTRCRASAGLARHSGFPALCKREDVSREGPFIQHAYVIEPWNSRAADVIATARPIAYLNSSLWRAASRLATQNAGEHSCDLMRLKRLGKQFTDTGAERVLCQDCAAIAA